MWHFSFESAWRALCLSAALVLLPIPALPEETPGNMLNISPEDCVPSDGEEAGGRGSIIPPGGGSELADSPRLGEP